VHELRTRTDAELAIGACEAPSTVRSVTKRAAATSRFVLGAKRLRLHDSQLLLGAVAGLRSPAPTVALDAIRGLAEEAHLSAVAITARRRL
jgi:hypothetical protein